MSHSLQLVFQVVRFKAPVTYIDTFFAALAVSCQHEHRDACTEPLICPSPRLSGSTWVTLSWKCRQAAHSGRPPAAAGCGCETWGAVVYFTQPFVTLAQFSKATWGSRGEIMYADLPLLQDISFNGLLPPEISCVVYCITSVWGNVLQPVPFKFYYFFCFSSAVLIGSSSVLPAASGILCIFMPLILHLLIGCAHRLSYLQSNSSGKSHTQYA